MKVSFSVGFVALQLGATLIVGIEGIDDSTHGGCPEFGTETELHFETATTVTTTLQQEDGNGELRFGNIGTHVEGGTETTIDLVVTRIPNTPYIPGNTDRNGVAGYFGQINVLANNGEGSFEFCFERSDTSERMVLEAFFFSFYDFDGTRDSRENIALQTNAFTDYFLTPDSELNLEAEAGDDGYTTFRATHQGDRQDNPSDPNDLSPEQQNRGVVFFIENTDCFFVKMGSVCSGTSCSSGRNIVFSGRANQLVPTCAPTAAPSEAPSAYEGGGVKTLAPTPSGAFGDPHIKTWTGRTYDFHGICDLVLFKNPNFDKGTGIDVHIRNERMGMWSFIKTAVIRIGEEKLEISGGRDNDSFLLNGVVQNTENGNGVVGTISGYNINFMQVGEKSRKFTIDLGRNQSNHGIEGIVFTTWNSFVSVQVNNPTKDHFDGSLGLMGSFPSGAMIARDGKTVIDDPKEFGEEWQVLNSEPQVFSQHGTAGPNSTCRSPSNVELRRRLQASMVTLKQAEVACNSVNDSMKDLCIFDVVATNEVSSAGAY